MTLVKSILTNILTALYHLFWFAVILSVFILFFYLYAYKPDNAGKGMKQVCIAWILNFKQSPFFRRLFCLVFFTVMILFQTLLNRNLWANPLSNVMGGWWIWKKAADGTVTLTTECFENIALMMPFTICLMWTAKEKLILKKRDGQVRNKIWFGSIIWVCGKTAFLFSISIEFLQLFLRLGTFQLSDICYNILGGVLGGIIYWIGWKLKCELPKKSPRNKFQV